jgi:flagellar biosynthetic protein FlhB
MSDRSQRTEKPTPQKLRKSREQGQFPAAKEFVSGLQFLMMAGLASAMGATLFATAQQEFRRGLASAFQPDLTAAGWTQLLRQVLVNSALPLGAAAGFIVLVTVAVQILSTNMGFSFAKLAPSLSRFKPMSRLKAIPRENLPQAVQAMLVLGITGYLMWVILDENLADFLRLPLTDLRSGISRVADSASKLVWRLAFVLFVFGAIEMLRHRWLYHRDLMMTKEEVKREHKDQEGDPHIKAQVRRIRRNLLRRRMMSEVPTATAVIVNPTHFAVAVKYDIDTMASPKVVAKGRNYLALKIRQLATENEVTIVENPPLARALYQAVEVGHDIPPDFYRAVAEVLAYVYRVLGTRLK